MTIYYLDTSAAVKLYVAEVGSVWLAQRLAPDQTPVVLSSALLRVELQSAFVRRLREGTVTDQDYSQMMHWLVEHRHSLYRLVPIQEGLIQRACELIEAHPLRGADAIHLATALTVNEYLVETGQGPLTVLSADDQLNQAAMVAGLAVVDPNAHP